VQRAKVVLYAAEGLSNVQIADRLGVCSKVVGQWRRRSREHRLKALRDQPRSARPRPFPPHEVAQVKAIACELPRTHGP
jgi:transposase